MAVKIFDGVRVDEAEPGLLLELRQEAQIMQKLSHHPHVINFVGAVTEGMRNSKQVLICDQPTSS